jgi:hypothetical protein
MLTGIWCAGIKVSNLERELQFHRDMGHQIVLDETFDYNGKKFRIPLIKMGDKYLSLMEKPIYEELLDEPRPIGAMHLVYISNNFDQDLAKALASGATTIGTVGVISAGFGERRLIFLRAPGGWFFEICEIITNLIPEV